VNLRRLADRFAICRLAPADPVPPWATGPGFVSITRTRSELSLVVSDRRVPAGVRSEGGWRALEVEGPIPFSATGVLASLVSPLAAEAVSTFAISTFDTDYLLVREGDLPRATAALEAAGHRVASGPDAIG
jgi:hypothetical protein